MTEADWKEEKQELISLIEKRAEESKSKTFFVHGHVAWIAVALFAVTTVCSIIDTVAPNTKVGQASLRIEHTIEGHPVIEKLVISELQKLLEKVEK